MRQDIDRNPQRIKQVLINDGVRKAFLKGASKIDAKVVKAFVASNAENALKTKPKVSQSQCGDTARATSRLNEVDEERIAARLVDAVAGSPGYELQSRHPS